MTIRPRRAIAASVAAALLTTAVAMAQDAGIRPVASVRQIMDAIVIPASDAIFNVSDPPKTTEDWAVLERQAAILAEGGNLLMLGSRARDTGPWAQSARTLVDSAANAAAAARAKNFDALLEASDAVAATCVTCHAGYLPKAQARN